MRAPDGVNMLPKPSTVTEPMLYRRAERADTAAICGLLGRVFPANPKTDPAVYRWQYFDNPFSPPSSWLAQDADGNVVGHAGLFATPGRIHDTPCTIGHAADAATAPGWRGRGIYHALSQSRLQHAANQGLPATIIIPNDRSREPATRSGIVIRHRVRAYVRPKRLPLKGSSPDMVTECTAEQLPHVPLDLSLATDRGRNGVHRCGEWIRWRYAGHPTRVFRYFFCGEPTAATAMAITAVVKRGRRRLLYVMEVLAHSPAGAATVLRAAISQHPRLPTVVVAIPHSLAAQAALRTGFAPLPHVLEPQPQYLGLYHASLGRSGPWMMSWGDHDHL